MTKKPEGKFVCLGCGKVWDGSQLFLNERTGIDWICGNLGCGALVVKYDEKAALKKLCKKLCICDREIILSSSSHVSSCPYFPVAKMAEDNKKLVDACKALLTWAGLPDSDEGGSFQHLVESVIPLVAEAVERAEVNPQ